MFYMFSKKSDLTKIGKALKAFLCSIKKLSEGQVSLILFIKHNETNPYTRFVNIYILGAKTYILNLDNIP